MARGLFGLTVIVLTAASCAQNPSMPDSSPVSLTAHQMNSSPTGTAHSNSNGVGGSMPAFYDGELFTINFKELPSGGETANLTHNGSINTIYMSDGCMPGGHMFISVLDAIQGDGFNPLWQEVQVVFSSPATCKQFTSDNDILAAAAAKQVTLQPTNELYRCAVIGKN
jgi:hypothetical protein